jgi:hypothetical protein
LDATDVSADYVFALIRTLLVGLRDIAARSVRQEPWRSTFDKLTWHLRTNAVSGEDLSRQPDGCSDEGERTSGEPLKRHLAAAASLLLVGSVCAVGSTGSAAAATGKPNLTIVSVDLSPITPAVGQGVVFSTTVKNTGTAPTPAGTIIGVGFKLDNKTTVTYSDTSTAALAPGATRVLTANDRPTGKPVTKATWVATAGKHTVTAWVDNINRIPESNENDNQMTVSFTPQKNLVSNGGFETGSLVPWVMGTGGPEFDEVKSRPDCYAGSNCLYSEGQDANTPTESQQIATVPGHTYVVSFNGKVLGGSISSDGVTTYVGGATVAFGSGLSSMGADTTPPYRPVWQSNSFRGKATSTTTPLDINMQMALCCGYNEMLFDNFVVVDASADLTVTKVTASPAIPKKGQPVKFSATIKNNGLAATPVAIVGALFRVDGKIVSWSDNTVTSIPAGGSVTVTANKSHTNGVATWPATSGKHTIQAQADDVNRIAEVNESNNLGTATLTVP